jgi:hypothetical protein
MAIVGAPAGKDRDDGIVVDGSTLADDEGSELEPKILPPPPAPAAVAPPIAAAVAAVPTPAALPLPPPAVPPLSPAATAAPLRDALGVELQPVKRASSFPRTVGNVALSITKKISINPFERKRSVWPLVVIAAIVGGGGVYLAVAPDAPLPPPKKEVAAAAVVVPKASQPGRPKLSAGERRDACVASYFDPGAFEPGQNFVFVCADGDLRDAASQLQRLVRPSAVRVDDAGAGATPEATRGDAGVHATGLDWYELPATAIIRKSCCDGAAPISLPQTPGWCEQLQTVVRRIADDSSKAGDLAPGARSFDRAVACLFANRVGKTYSYEKAPTAANRDAFQQFLSRAAISEARR